jgi:hypothetical protein
MLLLCTYPPIGFSCCSRPHALEPLEANSCLSKVLSIKRTCFLGGEESFMKLWAACNYVNKFVLPPAKLEAWGLCEKCCLPFCFLSCWDPKGLSISEESTLLFVYATNLAFSAADVNSYFSWSSESSPRPEMVGEFLTVWIGGLFRVL